MMLKSAFLPLILAHTAQADLACLGWGVVSPILGVVCAFKPAPFQYVDDKVSNAAQAATKTATTVVEEVADKLENLGEFDLTHNPATLAYNYIDTALDEGIDAANDGLVDKLDDFVNVTIGLGKTAANAAVTVLEWTHWQDFWYCTFLEAIGHGTNISSTSSNSSSSSNIWSSSNISTNGDTYNGTWVALDAATSIVKKCAGEKWERMVQPLVFKNITDPNQKIGGTIFDIATLLVPVAEGAAAGEAVVEGGYDLAIASAEDTTRVVKWLPDEGEGIAGSFESEEEALSVKEKLASDSEWPAENCAMCNTKPGLGGRSVIHNRSQRHSKRGASVSVCCRVPEIPDGGVDWGDSADSSADDEPIAEQYDSDSSGVDDLPTSSYDESELSPFPTDIVPIDYLKSFGTVDRDGIEQMEKSLYRGDLVMTSWSKWLTNIMDSQTFFTKMRAIVEAGPADAMYQKFDFYEAAGGRVTALDHHWLFQDDPDLLPFQIFAKQAMTDVMKLDSYMMDGRLGNSDIQRFDMWWFPPGAAGDAGRSISTGKFWLAASDQPGLVVENGGTATRVIPRDNTFFVGKGEALMLPQFANVEGTVMMPTVHADIPGPQSNGYFTFTVSSSA